ncbi:MAG TPA: response regulator transcription factor [Bryobacteraceae bacterium]|nr:response regulator transcription factor [Bryobacteraceae bacterium]
MTRVVVLALSPVARAGLESLLRGTGTVDVIGSVANWAEYAGEDPDIVLADWENGDDLSIEIADGVPEVAWVIMADDPGLVGVAEALRAGVRAVLSRHSSASQIVAAIEAASAGFVVLQPGDLDGLLVHPQPASLAEPLTPREVEVLGMLAEGQSNKSIAHRLGISEHTVKFHVTSIMGKLDAGSRTEAVTQGIRKGLIML